MVQILLHGRQWNRIAQSIGQRNENQTRNKYNSMIKKFASHITDNLI